jgi:hypothetical protein
MDVSLCASASFFLSFVFPFVSGAQVARTSVPLGATVSATCRSDIPGVWTKAVRDAADVVLATGRFVLPGPRVPSISVRQKDSEFILTLQDVSPSDGGQYICNNELKLDVTVVPAPVCGPKLASVQEELRYDFFCSSGSEESIGVRLGCPKG